jgi:hypothetical protein
MNDHLEVEVLMEVEHYYSMMMFVVVVVDVV